MSLMNVNHAPEAEEHTYSTQHHDAATLIQADYRRHCERRKQQGLALGLCSDPQPGQLGYIHPRDSIIDQAVKVSDGGDGIRLDPSQPSADGVCHFFNMPPEFRLEVYAILFANVKIRVARPAEGIWKVPYQKMSHRMSDCVDLLDRHSLFVCKKWLSEALPELCRDSQYGPHFLHALHKSEMRGKAKRDRAGLSKPHTVMVRTVQIAFNHLNLFYDKDNVEAITACPAARVLRLVITSEYGEFSQDEVETVFSDRRRVEVWDAIARARLARIDLIFGKGMRCNFQIRHYQEKYEHIVHFVRDAVELPPDHELGPHRPIVDWAEWHE